MGGGDTSQEWKFRRQPGSSVRKPAVDARAQISQHLSIEDEKSVPTTAVIRRKIIALASIASSHESAITSAEVLQLLPIGTFHSAEDLESFVGNDPILRTDLVIEGGELGWRTAAQPNRRRQQDILTEQRVRIAQVFGRRLARWCPWLRLVAISGSMAFGGTNPNNDIDFFVVTGPNRAWITLLIAMLGARFGHRVHPNWPVFCFNRVIEENECRDAFRTPQDPLFAREALSLRVLEGPLFHQELLCSASWMKEVFPELYRTALSTADGAATKVERREGRLWSVANVGARAILAPYLTIVGLVRNKRLLRDGNSTARFRTVIEHGFFAYESEKYERLRATYKEAFESP